MVRFGSCGGLPFLAPTVDLRRQDTTETIRAGRLDAITLSNPCAKFAMNCMRHCGKALNGFVVTNLILWFLAA
ncbi:MAG: hypothetical protein IPL59_08440 [Candidatus Competibacteraceae bacterium]|nr:hypothetical protein [Candidatus Competibacteraceae bacterium]